MRILVSMGRRKLNDERHKCQICEHTFSTNSSMHRHIRTHLEKKPYRCDICGKSYTDKYQLVIHFRMHRGERSYKCKICESSFTARSILNRHLKTHMEEKPYKCATCGNAFTEKANLIRHLRMHTGERPFACAICGNSFAAKLTLIRHLPIHVGERRRKSRNSLVENGKITCLKEYVEECGTCERPSLNRNNKHKRFRISEEPYQCRQCGNTEYLSDNTNHLEPFRCEFCDVRFAHKNTAMRHVGLHLGIEPYQCELCNKTFTQQKNLRIHMKSYEHLENVVDTNEEVRTEYIKQEEIDIKQEESEGGGGLEHTQMPTHVKIKKEIIDEDEILNA